MSAPEASNTRWLLRMTLAWAGGLGSGLTFVVDVWLGVLSLAIQILTLAYGLWRALADDEHFGRTEADDA